MSEQATEHVDPAAEWQAFEAEAGELLGAADADADYNHRASVLIRRFRKLAKEHSQALERTRNEARSQALAELRQARETEAAFRRIGAGEAVRPLFSDIDVVDSEAMLARVEELRSAGVTWHGMPGAPPPPPPVGAADPAFQAMQAMVQAEAGGNSSGNGDLQARLERMAAEPEKYSDEQVRAVIGELNGQVRASTTPGSGALG